MKSYSAILFLYTILILLNIVKVSTKRINYSGVSKNALETDSNILDALINSIPHGAIKVYDSSQMRKKPKNSEHYGSHYDECYDAIKRYTRDMYKGDYKLMLAHSFTDVGDMGNYEDCKALPHAAYNILQLNVTNLPIEARLGVCLPKECTQDMMKKAGKTITNTISGLAETIGNALQIEIIQKFNVGVQVVFVQPESWNEDQADSKTVSASIMGAIVILLIGTVGIVSVGNEFKSSSSIKDDLPSYGDKDKAMNVIAAQEEARVRESTKPYTFKFKNNAAGRAQRLDSVGNPIDSEEADTSRERENSIFKNETSDKTSSQGQNEPLLLEILK